MKLFSSAILAASALGADVLVEDSATIAYPNAEATTSWTITAANNGYLSMQFNENETALGFFKFDCQDKVTITYSDGSGASFCGPNKSNALVVPADDDDIGVFKKSSKTGQRVLNYPYMTQEQSLTVTYSGSADSKFEATFVNIAKEHVCKNRLNCKKIAPLMINSDHEGGYICKAHPLYLDKVCTPVDCTSNDHCGEKERCKKNVCEAVDCKTNDHCGEQQICQQGSFTCQNVECRDHKHCDNLPDGPYRCDGKKGVYKCKKVECRTQDDCSSDSLCEKNKCKSFECRNAQNCKEKFSGPGEKCESGTCECEKRKCVAKECKTHKDCKDPAWKHGGYCHENQCVIELLDDVTGETYRTCHSHKHCTAGMKCDKKRCVKVECKNAFDCDNNPKYAGKGPHLCYDENEKDESKQNTCYPVDCKGHDDCGDSEACINNTCEPINCKYNDDCGENHLCKKVDKKDPRKNFCEKVDCTSHAACKYHSNPKCQDGLCLCKNNVCKPQKCVKSEHCPDKHNCHDNKCVEQECSTHEHCDGYDTPHKCFSDCVTIPNADNTNQIKKCTSTCQPVKCRKETDCNPGDPTANPPKLAEICDGATDDRNPQCVEVECRGREFCGDQQICFENKCKTVECRTNAHCEPFNINGKFHVCDAKLNECVKVDCIGHDACGEYERCKGHKCVTVSCTTNEHCPPNPLLGVYQKCGKDDGKCVNIECQGHAACDGISNTLAGDDCTDGKCKCFENQCVKHQCRTREHCTDLGFNKHICSDNVCTEVTCTDHKHCAGNNNGRSTCRDNQCVNVDCLDREHCGDKQICSGYKEGNKCVDVECTSNLDCETNFGPTHRCLGNKCEEQTCRKNEHCWEEIDSNGNPFTNVDAKYVCEDNDCVSVECAHHDHCKTAGDGSGRYVCQERTCVKVECRNNDHCAADEVCSNVDQTCYPVECKGHAMCQEKALSGEIDSDDCAEGKCHCIEHECKVLECRVNAHCDAEGGYICDTDPDSPNKNTCIKVDCIGHDMCNDDPRPECQEGSCRCEKFECVPVSCRDNTHCDEGEICTGERVDNPDINGAYFINGKKPNSCVEVDCKGHDDCGEKERCDSYQCVPVQCTDESHCGEKELCRDAVCEEVECRDHTHCEGFFSDPNTPYKCKQQTCLAVECTAATDCGVGQLCDKATNECYKPECKGHASCEEVAGCEDGSCRCELQKNADGTNAGNKCIKVECRTNDHCPKAKELCDNETNTCYKVQCTSQDHCSQTNGHQKCEANKCKKVDCITNAHCGDKGVCTANQCFTVDCKTNGDCVSGSVCRNQTCVAVGCTDHSNCNDPDKPYCKRNKCVPMPRILDIIN